MKAFYGFDNEANNAVIRQPVPDLQGNVEAAVPGIFYEKRGDLYYQHSGKRSTVSGTVYARNRDFVDDLRDETTLGGEIVLARRLTRRTEGKVIGIFEHKEFENLSLDYDDYTAAAQLTNRINRKVSGLAEFRHRRRNSNDSSLEYNENSFFISLTYQFKP